MDKEPEKSDIKPFTPEIDEFKKAFEEIADKRPSGVERDPFGGAGLKGSNRRDKHFKNKKINIGKIVAADTSMTSI